MSSFSNVQFMGIDIGSQKTILVNQEADILLTDTGSVTRPTLISFLGKNRLLGEEAAPQIFSDNTLASFNLLLGKSLSEIQTSEMFLHRKVVLSEIDGQVTATVTYCGNETRFTINALVAMFLAKLTERIVEVHGSNYKLAFSLPPDSSSNAIQAIRDACQIAHVNLDHVFLYKSDDCLTATYGRKLSGLRPPERAVLEGKVVVLLDVGHTSTQVVVVRAYEPVKGGNDGNGPIKLGSAFSDNVGGGIFDLKMFSHFASMCETKHATKIALGTKRSSRLVDSCERLRKLLSQLPEAATTVENLTDNGDVTLSLRREELSTICAAPLAALRALILQALSMAGVDVSEVHGVELLGGGGRMQAVQAVVSSLFDASVVVGAKLDDCSVALGASLLLVNNVPSMVVEGGMGMSAADIQSSQAKELELQGVDAEVRALLAARNALEAYVLEMRGAPKRKHGQSIDAKALNSILDSCEDWIYENCSPDSTTDTVTLLKKTEEVRGAASALCVQYYQDKETERISLEKSLEDEAKKAQIEKEMNAGDEEDTTRLTKADRMRLVIKNKEEGNELFKGGNFRPAAARYHKALSHSAKFFDMNEEDKKEISALKLSLYLNLTSCYLKLELWDQAIRNADDALVIEPENPKAYFRRSAAHEGKKDWDKALVDIKDAQKYTLTNDKAISIAADRVKKEIQKHKEKEKKTWGKAFA